MRTIKRFEGYIHGSLCYEWELKQDTDHKFVYKLNGCTIEKCDRLAMGFYYLWKGIEDFLTHEEAGKILIKGS